MAAATQSATLGFCVDQVEFFSGQHDSAEHSCGHESEHGEEHHDCDEPQKPCDEEHIEFQIDLDDFSHSGKSVQLDQLPDAYLPTSASQLLPFLRPVSRITPLRLSQPPPDLPVYIRFGVLRL